MPRLDLIHFQQALVPPLLALAGIVKKGGKSGIRRPYDLPGTAGDQIVAHVKPFIDLGEYLRLVVFDPFVFPYRILCAG